MLKIIELLDILIFNIHNKNIVSIYNSNRINKSDRSKIEEIQILQFQI